MSEINMLPGQYWEVRVEIRPLGGVTEVIESFKGCGPVRFDDALQLARRVAFLYKNSRVVVVTHSEKLKQVQ